jgi:hypothetical protein
MQISNNPSVEVENINADNTIDQTTERRVEELDHSTRLAVIEEEYKTTKME